MNINKILPLLLVSYLGISIIKCPCDTLLGCHKEPTIFATLSLLALIIFEYPTPRG